MTRVNVVPVQELHQKHLVAEYREIVRVFSLVRNCQNDKKFTPSLFLSKRKPPTEYVLGTGHQLFFYTRLGYILNRYHELTKEMRDRGYNPNPIPDNDLKKDIDKKWFKEYIPTQEAKQINRSRISQRLRESGLL